MVTGKLVYEWKMGTSQIQSVVSESQNIKEEIIKRVPKPKYFDSDDEEI